MKALWTTMALAGALVLAGCLEAPQRVTEEREVEVPTVPRTELPPSCGNLTLSVAPVTIRDEGATVEARFGGCDAREVVVGQASCARAEDHFFVTVEVNATAWQITNGSAKPPTPICESGGSSEDRLAKGEWLTTRVAWNRSLLVGDSEERVPSGDYVVSAWLAVEGRILLERANVTVV